MSDLVKCPHCSKDIENDSFYCDQCGAELMYCPKCHIFGKGKFCSKCRTPLVPASKGASSQPVASNTANGTPASSNSAVPNQQPPVATGGNMSQSTSKPSAQPGMQSTLRDNVVATRLVGRSAGITLMLKDGAIIGRRNGEYAQLFSNQPYVSGTHASLAASAQGWTITDLGSTNGTMVNGNSLSANVPAPISIGDKVRIATLEFIVE